MIDPKQIPDEVVEAAARAMCRKAYEHLPTFNWEHSMRDDADGPYWRGCSRAAIAAALNAWPEKQGCWYDGNTPTAIIFPLPEVPQGHITEQEASDE